jgi:hypothetical protein
MTLTLPVRSTMDADSYACHSDIYRLLAVSRHWTVKIDADKRKGPPGSAGLLVPIYAQYRSIQCLAVGSFLYETE